MGWFAAEFDFNAADRTLLVTSISFDLTQKNLYATLGAGGELLSNRPVDQVMAVLCLHLIQVSLALVNTLMLQDVLTEDKWKAPMKPEDWRGLTPLFYQHVNPYGRFTLDLAQRLPLSLTNIG